MSLLDDMGLSSEAESVRRVRNGDVATYGVLYERHLGAARRVARSLLADRSDADDVVAEVFAATFAAMRKGRGPADDFRSYLLTSVRRECQRTWRRGGRQRPGGEQVVDIAAARTGDRDEIEQRTEHDVVQRVFASLLHHMRQALWASEVEGLSHAAIAARSGSTSEADATSSCSASPAAGARGSALDLASVFLPIIACGNSVGVLGAAATACDAAAAPSSPTTPGAATTIAGVRGLSGVGGTGGAIGLASSTGHGAASRVLAESGDGSDLPITGIAIGGTLLLATGLAGLGTVGRLTARRRTAAVGTAVPGPDC